MPETFQALAVLVLALLPGALYVWAFERQAGAWGARLTDRVLRFVEVSAILHALFAPLTYWLWITFIRSGRLSTGDVPLWLWVFPVLYVGMPILGGSLVGMGTRRNAYWTKLFTGPEPAPRAWDHLFGARPDGWVLLRMKSGAWIGGAYARIDANRTSYAAGYPEEQDLYLVQRADVDSSGQFVYGDDGRPVLRGSGILVRWSEVEYLEFVEA
jgi:Family of unknown function (DUF6338)